MPTHPGMSPAERSAREVIAAYVSAGALTQDEADQVLRKRLGVLGRVVRANCASSFGSAWYYGAQVRQAREQWQTSSGKIMRRWNLAALAKAEIQHAVYSAVRAEYKTPRQIEADDAAAPVLATVPQFLRQVKEDLKARCAAEACFNPTPCCAEILPVNGRVVIRAWCVCGGRHWRSLDLGPEGSPADAERLDYPLHGPAMLKRDQGVRITGGFEPRTPEADHAWRLCAAAGPISGVVADSRGDTHS